MLYIYIYRERERERETERERKRENRYIKRDMHNACIYVFVYASMPHEIIVQIECIPRASVWWSSAYAEDHPTRPRSESSYT